MPDHLNASTTGAPAGMASGMTGAAGVAADRHRRGARHDGLTFATGAG